MRRCKPPEVIRGQGYGFSCDWWSLGVIMYESLYGFPPFVSSSRHITRQKILNWKNTLKFPPHPRLSPECTDLMTRLLCEPEDRLGSNLGGTAGRASVLTVRDSGFTSIRGNGSNFGGLGSDGAERIKGHVWFQGIDWDNLHRMDPPYHPDLAFDDDTKHFDEDIPDEPLAPANGAARDATKDPLLGDKTHGAHLLEIRKSLAFKGWTFKAPQVTEKRYGHMSYISNGGSEPSTDEGSVETVQQGLSGRSHLREESEVVGGLGGPGGMGGMGGVGAGTVRMRALSL
ncbi:hypothetical protein EHS25_006098 [Saitozyma podzolica]|uniref:non-specific serine/threonine protein kinase n=1 Tax=Saitozyma podzolica TaxID=1890683 RepID=A0A427XTN6_9TREE|nr:hypothetical protein EHS25_006098 [Saitozyma podzolica]